MTDSSAPLAPGPSEDNPAPGILVADDDPVLLRMLQLVLQARGFSVWAAANGAEAVALYARHRAQISLVLLDVRMPGLDGPQALAHLRRLDSGVACCFMTGFAGAYSDDDLRALGAQRCYEKPFQVQQLADELWEMALRCAADRREHSPALSV